MSCTGQASVQISVQVGGSHPTWPESRARVVMHFPGLFSYAKARAKKVGSSCIYSCCVSTAQAGTMDKLFLSANQRLKETTVQNSFCKNPVNRQHQLLLEPDPVNSHLQSAATDKRFGQAYLLPVHGHLLASHRTVHFMKHSSFVSAFTMSCRTVTSHRVYGV